MVSRRLPDSHGVPRRILLYCLLHRDQSARGCRRTSIAATQGIVAAGSGGWNSEVQLV